MGKPGGLIIILLKVLMLLPKLSSQMTHPGLLMDASTVFTFFPSPVLRLYPASSFCSVAKTRQAPPVKVHLSQNANRFFVVVFTPLPHLIDLVNVHGCNLRIRPRYVYPQFIARKIVRKKWSSRPVYGQLVARHWCGGNSHHHKLLSWCFSFTSLLLLWLLPGHHVSFRADANIPARDSSLQLTIPIHGRSVPTTSKATWLIIFQLRQQERRHHRLMRKIINTNYIDSPICLCALLAWWVSRLGGATRRTIVRGWWWRSIAGYWTVANQPFIEWKARRSIVEDK